MRNPWFMWLCAWCLPSSLGWHNASFAEGVCHSTSDSGGFLGPKGTLLLVTSCESVPQLSREVQQMQVNEAGTMFLFPIISKGMGNTSMHAD